MHAPQFCSLLACWLFIIWYTRPYECFVYILILSNCFLYKFAKLLISILYGTFRLLNLLIKYLKLQRPVTDKLLYLCINFAHSVQLPSVYLNYTHIHYMSVLMTFCIKYIEMFNNYWINYTQYGKNFEIIWSWLIKYWNISG